MLEEGQSPIKDTEGPSPWISAGLLTLWPIPITVAMYLMIPGYIVPFLNNPIGRILIIGAFTSTVIGCVLARFCKNNGLRFLVVLAFVCPAILVPLLGPAMVGIFSALGPIMESSK